MVDVTLIHGDCLIEMDKIETGSVDAIIADLPYGTTACKWDTVIPFAPLWAQYKRIIKPRGAVVLFGSQPFTSALVMSNVGWFKYEWVWDKVNLYTNFLNAKIQPLRRHENVLVFANGSSTYNPQYREGKPYKTWRPSGFGDAYGSQVPNGTVNNGQHYPCSILPSKADIKTEKGLHPTQKPVALLEYLVRTYTNEGETVLDNTMGSGTCGVACANTGRDFVGIELMPVKVDDPDYFGDAQKRIHAAQTELVQLGLEG